MRDVHFVPLGRRPLELLWSNASQGVGGEDMSVRVQYGELEWMTLSSHRLERIRCLFGGSGGLDLVRPPSLPALRFLGH